MKYIYEYNNNSYVNNMFWLYAKEIGDDMKQSDN